MKISDFMSSVKQAFLPLILVALATHGVVSAGTVVVTPGSLAGYTYFPKADSTGGSGSGAGEDVSTLQRCVFTPERGDQTVTVKSELLYGYTKPIPLNYVVVGGDGGYGKAAGGGGSSIIALNGTVKVVGPGGDGGSLATEVRGRFEIKGGDSLRFVTGGGGGNGIQYTDNRGFSFTIGGGGGAGYKGGGGGGSHPSAVIPPGGESNANGKGGGTSPGSGGTVPGGFDGTAGRDLEGGIATYPDGSTLPNASATGSPSVYYWNSYKMGSTTPDKTYILNSSPWKFSATASRQGSPSMHKSMYAAGQCYLGGCWEAQINGVMVTISNMTYYETGLAYVVAGGGGSLGRAGFVDRLGIVVQSDSYGSFGALSFDASNDVTKPVSASGGMFSRTPATSGASIGTMPKPGLDMSLTRPANGAINGANPGQIVVQYQAPVCGLLQ